jgi:hypothetical protein
MFFMHVILNEAKDLSKGFGSHNQASVFRASIARFLAALGMTDQHGSRAENLEL